MMSEEREITVVLMQSGDQPPRKLEKRVRLPVNAGMDDLLRELAQAPEIHEQVRDCVLRASLDFIAHGEGRGARLLRSVDEQLASGGPVVFPAGKTSQDRKRGSGKITPADRTSAPSPAAP
ncbi:hypothetical protein JW848_11285 [Candidatus Bipolaricaulota bacterium]|nr:hypothetical protein [Candidatus Bipolaricaulota bacterium]